MPWDQPQPLERHSDQQRAQWALEVWTRLKFFQFDWTPGSIPANTSKVFVMAETFGDIQTKSCVGLRVGMGLKLTAPSPVSFLTWDCAVQEDDTLTLWMSNPTAAPIVGPGGTWTLMGIIA